MSGESHVKAREYFEKSFREDLNHWHYDSVPFRIQRHDNTFECIKNMKFGHVCEIGCAAGVFTRRLAGIADRVDAFDISSTVIKHNKNSIKSGKIRWKQIDLSKDYGKIDYKKYDLVVMMEVLHYLEKKDVKDILDHISGNLCGALLISIRVSNKDPKLYGENEYIYDEMMGMITKRFNVIASRAIQLRKPALKEYCASRFIAGMPLVSYVHKILTKKKDDLLMAYTRGKIKEYNKLLDEGWYHDNIEMVAWLLEAK